MRILKIALWTSAALIGLAIIGTAPATADQVFLDDVIIDGSLCVGFDCVNGESFGFDTIRVKENNVRIKFDDTSSTASFPNNDWQLTANDTSNGGANKFSIDDITGGRTPFTIEAGAPSHSLYVEDTGRVGFGTSTPVVNLHVKDGNTPTLRLEQDGSSGFTAQTWDLAGNEANFFIRDASNGSTLPFRIFPGAPSNAISIEATTGDVGVGTNTPGAALHVRRTNNTAKVLVEEFGAGVNNTLQTTNDDANQTWLVSDGTEGFTLNWAQTIDDLNMTYTGTTNNFRFSFNDGNLTLAGDVITAMCPGGCGPDYVFEPDYELMTLDELDAYVQENRHLPNVPSAADNAKGIKMATMQLQLLEKIEELTLYTIDQHKTIEALSARLEALEAPQSE